MHEAAKSSAPDIQTVGFIGLGRMGRPMSANLARAGFTLFLNDVNPASVREAAAQTGGMTADSPAEMARHCACIIVMLPESTAVEAVVEGANGLLSVPFDSKLVIDMSSSDPDSTTRLATVIADAGGILVDAPVSGGVGKAIDASLAIMTGGSPEALLRAEPLLKAMGSSLIPCGPVGSGHAMKVINNFVSAAGLLATCEGLLLARARGVEDARVIDVLNRSTGRNNTTENKLERYIVSERFDSGFLLALMRKDVSIAARLADRARLSLPLLAFIAESCAEAGDMLGPEADHTAILRYVEGHLKASPKTA